MTSTEPTLESNLRPTRQRTAVRGVLEACGEFRTAQEVHEALRESGENVGLSTVYRALQAMADHDEIDVLRTEDGSEAKYRRCSATHHHHLVCRTCGATVEIEGPAVERWANAVAEEHGYADISHTLELFGTCASCR